MESSLYADIAVLVAALALSAMFSAAETALISVRRSRLEALAEEGRPAAILARKVLDEPERFLASIEAANTTLAMLGAVAATLLLCRHIERPLSPPALVGAAAGTWVVFLLFAELLPKSVARRHADRMTLLLVRPVRLLSLLVYPVVVALVAAGHFLLRLVPGFEPPRKSPYVTEEEIKVLVEKGEEMGDLEEDEREMVTAIFDLDRSVVREVMVPRVDVTAVEADATLAEVVETVTASGHTRLPVYEETLDNVVGILHAKDLLRYLNPDAGPFQIRAVMREAFFVPEMKNAKDLLEEMRARRSHFAVVVDEYGGTAGIISLEDLIEEIVGEIRDEYDVEEEDPIVFLGDNTAMVAGATPIDDVNDELDINLPTEEYDSLGGWVVGQFGRVPDIGEETMFGDVRFVVESVSNNRVRRVRVETHAAPDEQAD
jgi:CBS domain containing-hemolysin-like protein